MKRLVKRAKRNRPVGPRLVGLVVLLCLGSAQASDQPNIVLIFSDDAGFNDFGFQETVTGVATPNLTPHLDSLASQAVVFSNGYVSAPVCSPSRAGLLTGQHQQRFGYERNTSNGLSADDGLPAGKQLVSHYLRQQGYTTGAIGKWHVGSVDGRNRPLDMGFDEFFGMFKGSRSFWGTGSNNNNATAIRRSINGQEVVIETTWVNEGDPTKYDPTNGRYLTDAFGEEAVSFIDNHADDEDPFFLYLPFSATHSPDEAKQQDLALFPQLSGTSKKKAAMTYAMDREVGNIMQALQDNGIEDDTIVVFLNDNGGTSSHDNTPLTGYKGSNWEGGIRVPFLIKAPGLNAGLYDHPVSSLDLLPTLLAASGGDPSQLDVNGVDLMPHLEGTDTSAPHELLYWRNREEFSVRWGDWKLTRPESSQQVKLFNLSNDISESTDLASQEPAVVEQLLRELTYWEATLDKPGWGTFGANDRNLFDHFVYRHENGPSGNWGGTDAWMEGRASNIATMSREDTATRTEDSCPNTILEFRTHDSGSYTSTNNLTRATGQTFMANELMLAGVFGGTDHQSGTIDGNAVLLVRSLAGVNPKISLDATSSSTKSFTFDIQTDIQLLHDLEIEGDGTQAFIISGDISDFYEPRSVTKAGAATLELHGRNTFGGDLTIENGQVLLNQSASAIAGAQGIVVASGGAFSMTDGQVSVSSLEIISGGTVDFLGGTLSVDQLAGDLQNNGGTFSPGVSTHLTTITGDYTQNSGALLIEIEGTTPGVDIDSLQVSGVLNGGGLLEVVIGGSYVPQIGQSFEVATATSVGGLFELVSPKDLDGSDVFSIHHGQDAIVLEVLSAYWLADGDLTFDGVVNVLDWQILQQNLYTDTNGLTPGQARSIGDFNGDLQVDRRDYVHFKTLFDQANGQGAFVSMVTGVPEPASVWMAPLAALAWFAARFRMH